MSIERVAHLEQALLAIIAAAGQRGVGPDQLCAYAVGGLMCGHFRHWANAEARDGAADEIEGALTILSKLRSGNAI